MRKVQLAISALIIGVGAISFSLTSFPQQAEAKDNIIDLYKTPTCGCCTAWGEAMEKAGYVVKSHIVEYDEFYDINQRHHVPDDLASCHTAKLNGKVLVGHMPIESVSALDKLPNNVLGLSVPGMPIGSLGMEQDGLKENYDVIAFGTDGERFIFKSY